MMATFHFRKKQSYVLHTFEASFQINNKYIIRIGKYVWN